MFSQHSGIIVTENITKISTVILLKITMQLHLQHFSVQMVSVTKIKGVSKKEEQNHVAVKSSITVNEIAVYFDTQNTSFYVSKRKTGIMLDM